MARVTTKYKTRIALRLMEIKGRGDTLERLHCAIESEITESRKRIESTSEGNSEDFAEALAEDEFLAVEELLGLAFVAAQSFITSIRTDIIFVRKVYEHEFGSKLSIIADVRAYDALKLSPPLTSAPQFSVVQVINAVANYWKHSEEWSLVEDATGGRIREVWALQGNQKTAVEIVTVLNLKPNSPGNMRTAAKALGVTEYDDLSPLRHILVTWASDLLTKLRVEFNVMKP